MTDGDVPGSSGPGSSPGTSGPGSSPGSSGSSGTPTATDEATAGRESGTETTDGDGDADRSEFSDPVTAAGTGTAAVAAATVDETGPGRSGDAVALDEDADGSGDTAATRGSTPTDGATATVESTTLRRTNHWVGVASVAFLTAGIGVVARSRPLFLAAVAGVAYLAYANTTSAPEPRLSVTRQLSDDAPDPGDHVTVTVTIGNEGSSTLPDLRVVEGVPTALAVVDGPARTATALRPGTSVTFEYSVLARRGEYAFDDLTVLARNASGSQERELALSTPATTLTCVPPVDATETVPLRGLTAPYTGRVATDSAGEGVEFASLREYQHGDPLSRLDWNRYARDGALATMEFREERMATVVVLLDLRREAYVQAGDDGLHAVDRGVDAARRLFNSLLESGDRVGISALSPADVWLAPGAGPTHQAKARHLLATHPALSPTPPDGDVYVRYSVRTLVTRLPEEAQVVFCSPLADKAAAYVARALQVRGHPVTVVSPDPTSLETTGGTLATVERSNRLNGLRTSGVRVVNWAEDETLLAALERGRRRWSV